MFNIENTSKLFMKLVTIDSISKEEREMADYLTKKLKQLGCQVKEDNTGEKIAGNAGNLIAEFPGSKEYPVILLAAHMDRVEPGRGIKAIKKDGYLISAGETVLAGDDLIGVTVILETLRLLKEKNITHGPIKILFTVAEEIGLLGSKNLDPQELRGVDYALIFDSEGEIGKIIYKAPSQMKFTALIQGKAAHAGVNPDKGINAIKIASQAISQMKLGKIDEETTANIGVIKGGQAANIVPDLVKLEGEARSHSEKKLAEQIKHMQKVIDKAVNKYSGQVKYDISRLYSRFALDLESDIIKLITKVASQLNLASSYEISGGGSDANILNQLGIPTINLAVGMEEVHSTEERFKLDNFSKLLEFTLSLLANSQELKNPS